MAFETGTCNYTIKWNVYFHVSGTELRGPQEKMGEYETKLDAEYALVEDGFSRKEAGSNYWRGRGGYAEGYITRVVEYDFN